MKHPNRHLLLAKALVLAALAAITQVQAQTWTWTKPAGGAVSVMNISGGCLGHNDLPVELGDSLTQPSHTLALLSEGATRLVTLPRPGAEGFYRVRYVA